jgi:hypothetical protein
MKDKGMEYMTGYGNATGYSPPSGSAGKAAFGEYSNKTNPLSVPRKGSSIRSGTGYGGQNADMQKMQRLMRDQEMKENLRGQSGC